MTVIELTEFVTLEHIPVLETGIAYPASTGPFTVTREMLEEVVASQDDPHIKPPRIKIAHADNAINDDLQELFEQVNEERDASKPSLGTLMNLEVDDLGILYADYYGLPAWFAAILETAYPARSIEGGHWRNDANNKEYAFMLEAVSFLGVVGPGCTSLEDLQELFSEDGPKVSVVEMSRPTRVAAIGGGSTTMPVQAQVNVEDIRRAFYEDFAQGDQYWWWDKELLIDPLEFIVYDPDNAQLYQLPIDLTGGDGSESVEFGDPIPVKIKYVPDPSGSTTEAAVLIAPQLEGAGKVLAVNNKSPRAAEYERRKEMSAMELDIPKLRVALNIGEDVLPDDATEEQISAAVEAGRQEETPEVPETPEGGDGGEGGDEEPEGGDEQPEGGEGGVAAERGVVMDRDRAAQLESDAAMGRQAREEQLEATRQSFLDKAVKAGKFPPKARPSYEAQLKKGGDIEKETKEFIDSLAESTVPVLEHGGDDGGGSQSAESYPTQWLSAAERERIKEVA